MSRCIDLRNRLPVLRGVLGLDGGSQGDEGHRHFVTILDTVKDPLKPLITGSCLSTRIAKPQTYNDGWTTGTGQVQQHASESVSIANRFADFNVGADDSGGIADTDDMEEMPDIHLPPPPRDQASSGAFSSRDEFGVEMSKEEGAIRALAFLVDVHTVRDHLKTLWTDYRDGKVNLITAGITANTALELLKKGHDNLAEHIVPLFAPEPDEVQPAENESGQGGHAERAKAGGVAAMLRYLRAQMQGAQASLDPTGLPQTITTSRDGNESAAEYAMLDIVEVVEPIYREWKANRDDPSTSDETPQPIEEDTKFRPELRDTASGRTEQNRIFIQETVTEMFDIASYAALAKSVTTPIPHGWVTQILTKGDQTILAISESLHSGTGELSLLALTGIRFMLDIHDILRADILRGEMEMKLHIERIDDSCWEFLGDPAFPD